MEEVQKMKMSRWLTLLILVRRVTRYVNRSVAGTVLISGGKPDRCRLEADAPAFSYDAGDVLPLGGSVLDLLGTIARNLLYCNYGFNGFLTGGRR